MADRVRELVAWQLFQMDQQEKRRERHHSLDTPLLSPLSCPSPIPESPSDTESDHHPTFTQGTPGYLELDPPTFTQGSPSYRELDPSMCIQGSPGYQELQLRRVNKALSLSLPDMMMVGSLPNGLTSPGPLSSPSPQLLSPPPLEFRPMSPALSLCSYTSFSSFVYDG